MAVFVDREYFTLEELLLAWTAAVRMALGRDDLEVWSDASLEPWIVYPGEICLSPFEADLIDGVMTPEEYTSHERILH